MSLCSFLLQRSQLPRFNGALGCNWLTTENTDHPRLRVCRRSRSCWRGRRRLQGELKVACATATIRTRNKSPPLGYSLFLFSLLFRSAIALLHCPSSVPGQSCAPFQPNTSTCCRTKSPSRMPLPSRWTTWSPTSSSSNCCRCARASRSCCTLPAVVS